MEKLPKYGQTQPNKEVPKTMLMRHVPNKEVPKTMLMR